MGSSERKALGCIWNNIAKKIEHKFPSTAQVYSLLLISWLSVDQVYITFIFAKILISVSDICLKLDI